MSAIVPFDNEVLAKSRQVPVLVDFWAEWCGPCRVLGPVLERAHAEARGRWQLVKVNVDLQPELAQRYQVMSIPAVKLFIDGEVAAEFTGALPEHELLRWLETYLPSPSREATAAAKAALAAGDLASADKLLVKALELDTGASEARVLLAELRFFDNVDEALSLLEPIGSLDPLYEKAEAVRTLATLGQRAKRATEKGDDWEKYFAGATAMLAKRYAEAFDTWIDLVRKKSSIDNEGPRRATVALLMFLGEESELAREYRRKLTSALY